MSKMSLTSLVLNNFACMVTAEIQRFVRRTLHVIHVNCTNKQTEQRNELLVVVALIALSAAIHTEVFLRNPHERYLY